MKETLQTIFHKVQALAKCVRLEYEEMCIPEKHKFVQAMHKFGDKFVHGLLKFVRLCNMEALQYHRNPIIFC